MSFTVQKNTQRDTHKTRKPLVCQKEKRTFFGKKIDFFNLEKFVMSKNPKEDPFILQNAFTRKNLLKDRFWKKARSAKKAAFLFHIYLENFISPTGLKIVRS